MTIIFKAVSVVLWAFCGIFILPCVFVAAQIFPLWVEWGESF